MARLAGTLCPLADLIQEIGRQVRDTAVACHMVEEDLRAGVRHAMLNGVWLDPAWWQDASIAEEAEKPSQAGRVIFVGFMLVVRKGGEEIEGKILVRNLEG
jgi:hypothetical protein